MFKRTKKHLALLLTVVMTLGLVPTGVFADEPAPTGTETSVDLIEAARAALFNSLDEMNYFVKDTLISEDGSDVPTNKYWVTLAQGKEIMAIHLIAQQIYEDANATLQQLTDVNNAVKEACDLLDQAQKGSLVVVKDRETLLKELEYTIQKLQDRVEITAISVDGSDVFSNTKWVTQETNDTLKGFLDAAILVKDDQNADLSSLQSTLSKLLEAGYAYLDTRAVGTCISVQEHEVTINRPDYVDINTDYTVRMHLEKLDTYVDVAGEENFTVSSGAISTHVKYTCTVPSADDDYVLVIQEVAKDNTLGPQFRCMDGLNSGVTSIGAGDGVPANTSTEHVVTIPKLSTVTAKLKLSNDFGSLTSDTYSLTVIDNKANKVLGFINVVNDASKRLTKDAACTVEIPVQEEKNSECEVYIEATLSDASTTTGIMRLDPTNNLLIGGVLTSLGDTALFSDVTLLKNKEILITKPDYFTPVAFMENSPSVTMTNLSGLVSFKVNKNATVKFAIQPIAQVAPSKQDLLGYAVSTNGKEVIASVPFTFNTEKLTAGDYRLSVLAVDADGHSMAQPVVVNFTAKDVVTPIDVPVVAPVAAKFIAGPKVTAGTTNGVARFKTDTTGNVYYTVVTRGAAVPSKEVLLTKSSQAVTADTEATLTTAALTPGEYTLIAMIKGSNNLFSGINAMDFTIAAPITVAPVLTGFGGGGGGGGPVSSTSSSSTSNVGTMTTTVESGITKSTLAVTTSKFAEVVKKASTNTIVIALDTAKATNASVTLPNEASTLKMGSILSVTGGGLTYNLPASEIATAKLAALLGIPVSEVKEITTTLTAAKVSAAELASAIAASNAAGVTLLSSVIEFSVISKVTTTADTEKSINVDKFTEYVTREIPLSDTIKDTTGITGVVFSDNSKTVRAVPTTFVTRAGVTYAVIKSLSNSSYGLVMANKKMDSVSGHWSAPVVNDFYSKGILTESDALMFKPDAAITRGEFAGFLLKAMGVQITTNNVSKFTDVSNQTSYDNAILIACNMGIVKGTSATTFSPNKLITRQEMSVMLVNAENTLHYGNKLAKPVTQTDLLSASEWAQNALKQVVALGIYAGYSDNTVKPLNTISKSEAVQVIKNALVSAEIM